MYCYVVIYKIAAQWSLVSEKERFEILCHAILSRHLGILRVDSLLVSRMAGYLWIYSGEAKGVRENENITKSYVNLNTNRLFGDIQFIFQASEKSKLSLS